MVAIEIMILMGYVLIMAFGHDYYAKKFNKWLR